MTDEIALPTAAAVAMITASPIDGRAVVGWILARRRGIEVWPLVVPIGVALVLAVVTYGNQRLRVIAEPSVVVLAAITGAAGVEQLLARRQAQEPDGWS